MRSRITSMLLLFALVLSACAPAVAPTTAPAQVSTDAIAQPTSESASPTEAPPEPTTPPVIDQTLTVYAAASLTESFNELGKLFEAQTPGVTVAFNFAGSQQLAEQLNQGAEVDVFASASKKYMEAAVTSKRVVQNNAKTFVTNRLVVIFPKANPANITTLLDLAKPGVKLDMADKSVPVGQYSLEFLDKAILDTEVFPADYKDTVLNNVVSYETDVKSVVSKVALGEADAGIVYVTDYNSEAEQLGKIDIPDALNSIATYPIATISDSKNSELAKSFVNLILSPEGQALLSKYGFIPAVPGS